MKKLTVFVVWILLPLLVISRSGQQSLCQDSLLISLTKGQIDNINITKTTLDGCIELVHTFRTTVSLADSLSASQQQIINSQTIQIKSALAETEFYKEKEKKDKKDIRRLKVKNTVNSIILYTFVATSVALGTLYLTKK